MSRALRVVFVGGLIAVAFAAVAHARLPRGAVLSADEQDADPATGVTLARGNAVISIESFAILGRADEIALRPASDEIQFKGRALVSVGSQRFEGEAVTCALDFSRCAAGVQNVGPPQSTVLPEASAAAGHAPPSPSLAGAAATNP